jgi:lipoprotein-anchoring transpeptidase ErfK/SrfK
MKRLVAVFLIASPAWIASGVAGWWLGGGRSRSLPSVAEFASKPAPAAPSQPVQHPLVRMKTAAPKAGVPVAPPPPHAAPNLAMTAPAPQPKIIAPPPPPRAPAPEPIASLGSTDVSAPEQALAPAPAGTATASKEGVLIVVSLASQKAFVFKDGELWGSTAVSTGRKGKRTPVGRYTILEKQVHHRSRTYDNAPMPYMQRLTWGGVALHAGHVTGRPASHGCIRLPRSFAKKLYNLTDFSSTTVVVTNKKARSSDEALGAA